MPHYLGVGVGSVVVTAISPIVLGGLIIPHIIMGGILPLVVIAALPPETFLASSSDTDAKASLRRATALLTALSIRSLISRR